MIAPRTSRARAGSLRRFLRRDDGTALVEFGISLPTILIILFAIIETSRMLFAYQAAVGGVRDAARYFGRMVPPDVCPMPSAEWDKWIADAWEDDEGLVTAKAIEVVGEKLIVADGENPSVFPGAASLTGETPVTVSIACPNASGTISGLEKSVSVVNVTATVRIDFPFGSVFSLFGESLGGFTTTITDTSRALGS